MSTPIKPLEKPLIFHKFYWFFLTPCSFVGASIKAVTSVGNMATAYTPFQHGGLLLAVFLLYCLMEAAFVSAPAVIFFGFWRWKKLAWYVLMFLSISNSICTPLLFFFKTYDTATIAGKILGVCLDLFTIYYYRKHKNLFIGQSAKSTPSADLNEITCLNCGGSLPAGCKFCSFCGASLAPKLQYCRICGKELPIDSKFCSQCGTKNLA